MTVIQTKPLLPASDAAVLLVLLPDAGQPRQLPPVSSASLTQLQHRLGGAVRVLKIDEASHPTVVRSFQASQLPSCVLVRQGIELWRQVGLPEDEAAVAALLSKLGPAEGTGVTTTYRPNAQPVH
ncbi:hypothetical protein GCM10027048_13830 [Hymenobacter coalescens]